MDSGQFGFFWKVSAPLQTIFRLSLLEFKKKYNSNIRIINLTCLRGLEIAELKKEDMPKFNYYI